MRQKHPEAGLTLVEVVVASTLLMLISLATLSVMGAAQKGYSYSRARTHIEDKTRFVLKEIVRELASTGMTCPDWSLTSSKITYRRCSGYDFTAENRGWGNRRSIELLGSTIEFTEVDSGGGLIFSRPLVDEVSSFDISQDAQNPDLLTITLGLEGIDSQGNAISVSRSAAVFLRN